MADGNFEEPRPSEWQLLSFDHLVVACDDAEAGAAWLAEQLGGIAPEAPVGADEDHGCRFLSLGAGEVIAVVPRQARAVPSFAPGAPRLAAWGLSTDHLETALQLARLRGAQPMRTTLCGQGARIAALADGALPCDGMFPMLTAWDGPSPGQGLPDRGCRLAHLAVSHPEAERIWRALSLSDMRVELVEGPPGLKAVIDTPDGPRTLG